MHKHTIIRGNKKDLLEFHSVKFQTVIQPPKFIRNMEGMRKHVKVEEQDRLQELDQIFIKEYDKVNN